MGAIVDASLVVVEPSGMNSIAVFDLGNKQKASNPTDVSLLRAF